MGLPANTKARKSLSVRPATAALRMGKNGKGGQVQLSADFQPALQEEDVSGVFNRKDYYNDKPRCLNENGTHELYYRLSEPRWVVTKISSDTIIMKSNMTTPWKKPYTHPESPNYMNNIHTKPDTTHIIKI